MANDLLGVPSYYPDNGLGDGEDPRADDFTIPAISLITYVALIV